MHLGLAVRRQAWRQIEGREESTYATYQLSETALCGNRTGGGLRMLLIGLSACCSREQPSARPGGSQKRRWKLYNEEWSVYTGSVTSEDGWKDYQDYYYENCVHVPLYIVHPEYEGGRTISARTSHLDLAPTFLDMTGLDDAEKA